MTGQGIVYDFSAKKFIPLRKAAVPITDLVIQRAFGLTEVLRTYNRAPFALDEHLARFERSKKLLGLKGPTASQIKSIIAKALKIVKKDMLVKIILTGGDSWHITPMGNFRTYLIFAPIPKYSAKNYTQGVKLLTTKAARTLPEAKSTDYFAGVLATTEAKEKGYDEILFLSPKSELLEGSTFNFAIIKGREFITAKNKVLDGITMRVAVSMAKRIGLKVSLRPIKYQELKTADEAIITSTIREITPAVKVDKVVIGAGRAGKWTKALLQEFRQHAILKSGKKQNAKKSRNHQKS